MSTNAALRDWLPLTGFLAAALGDDAEVALHDLTGDVPRIAAIAHPASGDRSIGASSEDDVSAVLAVIGDDDQLVHVDRRDANGIVRRSHALLLRDEARERVGLLSVQIDQRRMLQVRELLDALTRARVPEESDAAQSPRPRETSVRATTERRLRELRFDVSTMTSEDKAALVADLRRESLFERKGAVGEVAAVLHVSDATVYRYLALARRADADRADEGTDRRESPEDAA